LALAAREWPDDAAKPSALLTHLAVRAASDLDARSLTVQINAAIDAVGVESVSRSGARLASAGLWE
jgi:hypothetical protein